MTPYRSPHHDTLSFNRHSEWRQEYFVRKQESGNMTWSEESMTLMTSYHFPHHGNRSFAIASGWRLMVFDIASGWRLSSVVILNGGKNALWERRETGQWHGVKNLLLGWHLTVFLTTVIDPSHSFRMTPSARSVLRLLPFAKEGSLKIKYFQKTIDKEILIR